MNQRIRKQFYTFRNGVVADALKRAGDPHSVIFGLQLPQLSTIAKEIGEELSTEERDELARELWREKNCRESRLLASWMWNPDSLTVSEAKNLLDDCQNHEEIDILVFRSLRFHPEAQSIRNDYKGSYIGEAFSRFL